LLPPPSAEIISRFALGCAARKALACSGCFVVFVIAIALLYTAWIALQKTRRSLKAAEKLRQETSQRQRVEETLRQAQKLESLGTLAGGIAHDFNNLLTAIIGNISLATLLLRPNDEMATRLRDAKNASMRARDLAQQLLTFARGGTPIKKTASIGKLIQDTVSFSLRGTHSRSEFDFGPDLWPAEIDAGQISQVVANLVVNADQAMPNGGTLRVSCHNFTYDHETTPCIPDLEPGEYIRISIRDEGVGISEGYLKRIFDPYFTTKEKGNGLGLATTYSIIKNHNGLITVQSQIHCGATFTLYLPASLEREAVVEPAVTTIETIEGTGRILIVDDEEARPRRGDGFHIPGRQGERNKC
jgi:signal transduction histidine kinase